MEKIEKTKTVESMRLKLDEESVFVFDVERTASGEISHVHFGPGDVRLDARLVRAIGAWLMDQTRPKPVRLAVEAARARLSELVFYAGITRASLEEWRDCLDIVLDGEAG